MSGANYAHCDHCGTKVFYDADTEIGDAAIFHGECLPKRDAAVVGPYRDLLREFVDDDPCEFDHHGGCQTHGFYEPSPGERCPNALAKELLEDAPPTGRTDPMDPVKELQDLDEHLRQHKRQWEDDEALSDDYWTGFEDARRIVGDHLAASRQRRGW